MQKYLALLRGINVGGNNIIKMEVLKVEFKKLGFKNVKTYIQSGNVIFNSEIIDKTEIEKVIEKGLSEKFNYKAKVLIRSKADLEHTVTNFPPIFNNPDYKHNVIFLSQSLNHPEIVNQFTLKSDIEQLSYSDGTLYWSAALATLTKSTMVKLSARKEYQEMTVRNINTTRKLLELLNS